MLMLFIIYLSSLSIISLYLSSVHLDLLSVIYLLFIINLYLSSVSIFYLLLIFIIYIPIIYHLLFIIELYLSIYCLSSVYEIRIKEQHGTASKSSRNIVFWKEGHWGWGVQVSQPNQEEPVFLKDFCLNLTLLWIPAGNMWSSERAGFPSHPHVV